MFISDIHSQKCAKCLNMDDAKHNEKKNDGVKSKESNKIESNNKDPEDKQITENGDHETVIERLDGIKRIKIKPNNEDREGKQILEKADHETVIERLEKLVHFLKGTQTNEEYLEHIKKPLDYIEVSLKNIPNGPFFNEVFPMEIKKYILSLAYSCDYQAFIAATVCQDWKNILEARFKDKKVVIGESCSKCEYSCCVKPVDMMKAAIVHKIKTHLVISKGFVGINSNLIVDALTSISKFTIANYSNHPDLATLPGIANIPDFAAFLQFQNARRRRTILSNDQLGHLFESIENGDKIMEDVRLVLVNFRSLNQDILANCLVNKTKRLTLDQADGRPEFNMLDVNTFIRKLQDSPNIKLTHLTLEDFSFVVKDGLANVVKALCNVENLKWSGQSRNIPLTSTK